MKKQRVLMIVLTLLFIVSVILLSAANPWKARFKVINQTDEDIYIILRPASEDGEYYPQLIARGHQVEEDEDGNEIVLPEDELRAEQTSKFTIVRDIYEAEVIACGMKATGSIDLTRNLKLNFTPCEDMAQYWTRKYHGEPSMEKPNWFRAPGMIDWRFVYSIPTEEVDWEVLEDLE